MVELWQHPTLILIIIHVGQTTTENKVSDWTVVERLAEEHPYVVALLDVYKNILCTGIIASETAVLTSGNCAINNIMYVAVGKAVVSRESNSNGIFTITGFTQHGDYEYDMRHTHPNFTVIHSNVGMVFTTEPFLEMFFDRPEIGDHYASELKDKHLTVYGYGLISKAQGAVMQKQEYVQTTCLNPKWYYCICGTEQYSDQETYEKKFGAGAPVLYGNNVVGIAAAPCGTLLSSDYSHKYNIFTVIGPYKLWLQRPMNVKRLTAPVTKTNGAIRLVIVKYFYIFLLIREVLF